MLSDVWYLLTLLPLLLVDYCSMSLFVVRCLSFVVVSCLRMLVSCLMLLID